MAPDFAHLTDLDNIRTDIWTRWTRGGADRRSPFHTPVVASVNSHGAPEQRVMVLRKFDPVMATMRFHTDRRSSKVEQIRQSSVVNVLGYDAQAKVQIRASGMAAIHQQGATADAAWAATSVSGRRSYMAEATPGSTSTKATSGLASAFEGTLPTLAESEAARVNFAVLLVTINRLEWLYLAASGHRRAVFTRYGNSWAGHWLVP
jgi:pyridoxamine 5'-phosphate oxidase